MRIALKKDLFSTPLRLLLFHLTTDDPTGAGIRADSNLVPTYACSRSPTASPTCLRQSRPTAPPRQPLVLPVRRSRRIGTENRAEANIWAASASGVAIELMHTWMDGLVSMCIDDDYYGLRPVDRVYEGVTSYVGDYGLRPVDRVCLTSPVYRMCTAALSYYPQGSYWLRPFFTEVVLAILYTGYFSPYFSHICNR